MPKPSTKKALFYPAIAAIVTFLVYLPSTRYGFVLWDDDLYILGDRLIRFIDRGFFRDVFTTVIAANWHPLTIISYAVDFRIWGLDPHGYHLVNIVFHTLNTFLAGVLACRLYETGAAGKGDGSNAALTGFLTAVLFGLHPLHVESVAWISERKDVLSGFFFLLSILQYLRYVNSGRGRISYFSSLAFFALALLSKPMAITLPLVLLVLDFYPLERFNGRFTDFRLILEKAPFLALSLVSAWLTVWAQRVAIKSLETYPLAERLPVAVRAYAFYLYKMMLPIGLAPYYPRPLRAFDLFFPASLLLLIAITAFCALTIRRRRIFSAVWAYYVITLLPVIGIIQVGNQAAADRYTYLPLLGVFIQVSAALSLLLNRSKKNAFILAAAVTVVLGVLTLRQERVWKDSISLWSREIEVYPDRLAWQAYNHRGVAYYDKGNYLQAIKDHDRAIELDPGYGEAYNNRANDYSAIGDYTRALEDYTRALRADPTYAQAYINRGILYRRLAQYEPAIRDFDAARKLKPDSELVYINLGVTYLKLMRYNEAVENLKMAISIDPRNGVSYHFLGLAYSGLGDNDSAGLYLNKAARLGASGPRP